MVHTPAGWYPDAADPDVIRYWDGSTWTGAVRRVPPERPPESERPPTHLIWGVLATVVACNPVGIVSIVHAVRVDELWVRGDPDGARAASNAAARWAWMSLVLYVGFWVAFVAVVVLVGWGLEQGA